MEDALQEGDRVRVHGLVNDVHLNGRVGTVQGKRPNQRFAVLLDGSKSEVGIRGANLSMLAKSIAQAVEEAKDMQQDFFELDERFVSAEDIAACCSSVVIVQIPLQWVPNMLDLQKDGVDRCVLETTFRSVMGDALAGMHKDTAKITMVFANEAHKVRELLCKYENCALVIKYIPGAQRAAACCMRQDCLRTMKAGEPMVRCGHCNMPRYCSSHCSGLDLEHQQHCSVDFADALMQVVEDGKETVKRLNTNYADLREKCDAHPDLQAKAKMFFETCHSCGKSGHSLICGVCKSVRYCSSTCQKKHWPKHKAQCKLRPAVLGDMCKHVTRQVESPKQRPLPHDKDGKLLKLGQKALLTFLEAHVAGEKGKHTEKLKLCLEACEMRNREGEQWEALDDIVGAVKAYHSAGMYAMELYDANHALTYFRTSLQVARKASEAQRVSRVLLAMISMSKEAAEKCRVLIKFKSIMAFVDMLKAPGDDQV